MKQFTCFASVILATILVVTSNLYAQSPPVYQYFNQVEQFDGNRCEEFADTENLFGESFTMATYASVADLSIRQPFIANQTDQNRAFWFGIENGYLIFEAWENSVSSNTIASETLFPVNQWVYVVVKYDKDAGTIQLEQDGQIIDTKPGVRSIRQNELPISLGCYEAVDNNPQFHYYLNGKIQGTSFYAGADLNVAQPTPDGSPQNPTPPPTDDSDETATPTPSSDGEEPSTGSGDPAPAINRYTDAPNEFDGSTCDILDNSENIFAGDFTINTQVNLAVDQFRHVIVSQEVVGDRGLVFMIENGKPLLQIHSNNADSEVIEGSTDVPINQWAELTATFSDGLVTIELNGEEVARQENVPPMRASTALTRAGCYLFDDGTNRWYLEGELRNLRLYDTAEEIVAEITPSPVATPDPNETPDPADSGEVHTGEPGLYGGSCNTIEGTDNMFSGDWTFSAYVRPLEEQERHPIMTKEGDEERGVVLEIADGKAVLQVYEDDSIEPVVLESTDDIPVNVWTHIGARYSDGVLSLWINGIEVDGKSGVSPVASNDQNVNLGCYIWNEEFQWFLFGEMQDVTFVDGAVDITPGTQPSEELPPPPAPVYEALIDEVKVFDGTECLPIDDPGNIFAGNWTAELQFRMTQAQSRQPLFSDMTGGTTGRGLLLSIEEGLIDSTIKEPVLEIYSDDFTKNEVVGDIQPAVGQWYHISASYNNGTVRLYVDGILVATKTGVPAVQNPNAAPLNVGCYVFDGSNSYYFAGEMSNIRFYNEATTTVPGTTPIPSADAAAPTLAGYERGRVQVVGGNLVTENGRPLRGEHVVFANGSSPGPENSNGWSQELMYDRSLWRVIRDQYHLNTVRLMMSRPPQNWFNGPGNDCSPPGYRCYSLDYVHPNGKTTVEIVDDLVRIAADLGMYVVIDYHPVLGHDKGDASLWWARMAPRYKDHTHVIYELMNEPWGDPSYPGDLVDFEETLYAQVRAAAPETHIIAWSFANTRSDMSVAVGQGSDIDYANASVGFHPYEWPEDAASLSSAKASVTTFRQSYPVISTEIGGDRMARVRDMEELGISWIGLDNIQGLPGLEGAADTHGVDDVFWDADPDATDKTEPEVPTNQAPTLATLVDQSSLIGESVSVQVSATDADGNALIYTADGLPAGLTMDVSTGLIIGRISSLAGTYTVTVDVSDGSEIVQGTFMWVVRQGPLYLPMTLHPR